MPGPTNISSIIGTGSTLPQGVTGAVSEDEKYIAVSEDVDGNGTVDRVSVADASTGDILVQKETLTEAQFQAARNLLKGYGFDVAFDEGANAEYIKALPAELQADLNEMGTMVGIGKPTGPLQSKWAEFIGDMQAGGLPIDVNALVQAVLRESYLSVTQDLYFYAEKVKFFNAVKKAIRDELTTARKKLQDYAALEDKATIPAYAGKDIATTFTGGGTAVEMTTGQYSGAAINTKGKLDAYIQGLEEKLSSVGDDAQLANVDLQNILQKQQQVIQLMSNISKMLHDTAMAIIRKVGG